MGEILIDEKALSPTEKSDLVGLEQVIKENFIGFVSVGKALAEINERRLYRNDLGRTFEGYCKELWDMCSKHAYRLMGSAKAVENLSNWRQNNPQVAGITLPQNEAQARELARLAPEEQRQVWTQVIEEAGGGTITARRVKGAVKIFKGAKLEKTIRQSTGSSRQNKTDRMSEEFSEAWDQLWLQVDRERQANWRQTSRQIVHKRTSMLLAAVAEAGTTRLKKPEVSLELSDREKLVRAGFRIFRMRAEAQVIEEWDRYAGWLVAEAAPTPTELLEKFNTITSDPKSLRA